MCSSILCKTKSQRTSASRVTTTEITQTGNIRNCFTFYQKDFSLMAKKLFSKDGLFHDDVSVLVFSLLKIHPRGPRLLQTTDTQQRQYYTPTRLLLHVPPSGQIQFYYQCTSEVIYNESYVTHAYSDISIICR